jgi:hypothetical protein
MVRYPQITSFDLVTFKVYQAYSLISWHPPCLIFLCPWAIFPTRWRWPLPLLSLSTRVRCRQVTLPLSHPPHSGDDPYPFLLYPPQVRCRQIKTFSNRVSNSRTCREMTVSHVSVLRTDKGTNGRTSNWRWVENICIHVMRIICLGKQDYVRWSKRSSNMINWNKSKCWREWAVEMSEVNRVKNTLENRFKPHNKNKSLEGSWLTVILRRVSREGRDFNKQTPIEKIHATYPLLGSSLAREALVKI